jgi:hypothetical protein
MIKPLEEKVLSVAMSKLTEVDNEPCRKEAVTFQGIVLFLDNPIENSPFLLFALQRVKKFSGPGLLNVAVINLTLQLSNLDFILFVGVSELF